MSGNYVYVMKDLCKSYGTKQVLKNIYLSFYPGAKIGVLGNNGAGKSTILKIMAGIDKDFSGEAWAAKGVKIGYLEQEPQLDPKKNVYDNILDGLKEKQALIDEYNAISTRFAEEMSDDEMNDLIERQGQLQDEIDICDAWNIERDIGIAMDALNCPPKDADVTKISGGERRRVALCRLLLEKPDMLLLDEPTNHLDAESVSWLERFLREYSGTVVMITHDRYFLDNVTGWILELERGEGIPWEGNYTSWLDQKQRRMKQEEKSESEKQKQLAQELEWVRQSPKARQAKSKARLQAYEELKGQVNEKRNAAAEIVIPDGPRLGNVVIEAKHIAKSFGGKELIKDLSFLIPPSAIVGIIGHNGAGKTTLFKMITGQETPDKGEFKIGETVRLGYIDQSRDSLNAENNVWEEISGGSEEISLGERSIKSRAYCAAFNFRGPDQQKIVGSLSGGERNRVHLAKMLKNPANVILLDEPTNDLDVDTLRALEEAILDYSGCVFVISHDRWFLNRVATHIICFKGDGVVEFFEGNYEDFEKYQEANDPDFGKKAKYKKISK